LAVGRWLLVVGCWSLAVGRWLLVVGCWPGGKVASDHLSRSGTRKRFLCNLVSVPELQLFFAVIHE